MLADGTLITTANRDDWLAARREGVGASEAGSALGVGYLPRRKLYLLKTGRIPEDPPRDWMRMGTLMEPVIEAEYERRTGNSVAARQRFRVLPRATDRDPYLFATLDGWTAGGYPVDYKLVNERVARGLGPESTDLVPMGWIVQAHQQMLVTETDRVDFAVLVWGEGVRIYVVRRSEELIDLVGRGVREFWGHVVERRIPPEIEHGDLDLDVLKALYPGCSGTFAADRALAATITLWRKVKESLGLIGDQERELRAEILEAFGERAVATLVDGETLVRRVTPIDEAIVTRKAHNRVTLTLKGGN
jgi:predicted phage-related endonuclease